MLSSDSPSKVFVSGSGPDNARRALLVKLLSIHPIDSASERAFASGERIFLCEVSNHDAQKLAVSLRAAGLRVDIEAANAMAMVDDLESFTREGPKLAAPESVDMSNSLFDVGVGLVGLDGEDDSIALPPPVATHPAPASGTASDFIGIALSDDSSSLSGEPQTPPPPAPPRAAAPVVPPPTPHRPPASISTPGVDALELDSSSRYAPRAPAEAPSPRSVALPPAPRPEASPDKEITPRCLEHGIVLVAGTCSRCEAEEAKIRGRLFGGKLHRNIPVRLGIGLVAGLLLGWIATAPMARRAERSVDYIREEAKRERERPLEEAQAHAAVLDGQAEEASSSAFYRTLGVWALITAAVTGAWFRLT